MSADANKPEFFTRPVLAVADVGASIAYYCEKLGFEKAWDWEEEGRPRIAEVGRRGVEVILEDGTSAVPRSSGPVVLSLTLHDEEALGALRDELRERGAKIVAEPFEVVWAPGVHQLEVEDLDGNQLIFWGKLGQ